MSLSLFSLEQRDAFQKLCDERTAVRDRVQKLSDQIEEQLLRILEAAFTEFEWESTAYRPTHAELGVRPKDPQNETLLIDALRDACSIGYHGAASVELMHVVKFLKGNTVFSFLTFRIDDCNLRVCLDTFDTERMTGIIEGRKFKIDVTPLFEEIRRQKVEAIDTRLAELAVEQARLMESRKILD